MSNLLQGAMGHLTSARSNDEIKSAAFSFVHKLGYMTFSTIGLDGHPASRGLEIHYLV